MLVNEEGGVHCNAGPLRHLSDRELVHRQGHAGRTPRRRLQRPEPAAAPRVGLQVLAARRKRHRAASATTPSSSPACCTSCSCSSCRPPRRSATCPNRRRAGVRAKPRAAGPTVAERQPNRTLPLDSARIRARSTISRCSSASPSSLRQQPQARVLRAQLEQLLLGLDVELDGRGHAVGVHGLQLRRLDLAVGRFADQLPVELVRGARRLRVALLHVLVHALDHARRIGELVLALEQPERARAAREDVQATVVHSLEHVLDLARATDRLELLARTATRCRTAGRATSGATAGSARSCGGSGPRRCAAARSRSAAPRCPSGNSGKPRDRLVGHRVSLGALGAALGGLARCDHQVVEDRRRQPRLEQPAVELLQRQVAAVRIQAPAPTAPPRGRRWPRACGWSSRTSSRAAPRRERARPRSPPCERIFAARRARTRARRPRPRAPRRSPGVAHRRGARADRAAPQRRDRGGEALGHGRQAVAVARRLAREQHRAARREHALELGERALQVGDVVQHRVAEHEVEAVVRERQALGVGGSAS